jgi:hypothetical protein
MLKRSMSILMPLNLNGTKKQKPTLKELELFKKHIKPKQKWLLELTLETF